MCAWVYGTIYGWRPEMDLYQSSLLYRYCTQSLRVRLRACWRACLRACLRSSLKACLRAFLREPCIGRSRVFCRADFECGHHVVLGLSGGAAFTLLVYVLNRWIEKSIYASPIWQLHHKSTYASLCARIGPTFSTGSFWPMENSEFVEALGNRRL